MWQTLRGRVYEPGDVTKRYQNFETNVYMKVVSRTHRPNLTPPLGDMPGAYFC